MESHEERYALVANAKFSAEREFVKYMNSSDDEVEHSPSLQYLVNDVLYPYAQRERPRASLKGILRLRYIMDATYKVQPDLHPEKTVATAYGIARAIIAQWKGAKKLTVVVDIRYALTDV